MDRQIEREKQADEWTDRQKAVWINRQTQRKTERRMDELGQNGRPMDGRKNTS